MALKVLKQRPRDTARVTLWRNVFLERARLDSSRVFARESRESPRLALGWDKNQRPLRCELLEKCAARLADPSHETRRDAMHLCADALRAAARDTPFETHTLFSSKKRKKSSGVFPQRVFFSSQLDPFQHTPPRE